MIRQAHAGDLQALLQLYLSLHETEIPPDSARLQAAWSQILSDPNHHIVVAEGGGRLCASCACVVIPNLTRDARPYALIENVVTDRACRRRGYASRCLRHAVALAETAGCYKVMLLTGAKQEGTLRFYEKAGFNSADKTAFIRWL